VLLPPCDKSSGVSVLRGMITPAAGITAKQYGRVIGAFSLAFPAIFPGGDSSARNNALLYIKHWWTSARHFTSAVIPQPRPTSARAATSQVMLYSSPRTTAHVEGDDMPRKYGRAAGKSVQRGMHRKKKGTLKSGNGGKGGTVKSRKQAIAIGLSEARKKGAKVPKKKSS
jgi:Family of unknown function (DUF6496)